MDDCYGRGGNTTPARVFFFFFFFSFLFFFCLSARCSGLGVGQVGGWAEEKGKIWIPFRTHRRRYTPLSPKRIPPSVCQTAVSHAVRCTVSWAVGPGITDRFVYKPTDPSPFPIPVANKRADIPTCPHPSLCVRTRKSAIFIFFVRRRPLIGKPNHHSVFFSSATPDACRPPSTHFHISLNSPRTSPVMSTDRMHAGLRRPSPR